MPSNKRASRRPLAGDEGDAPVGETLNSDDRLHGGRFRAGHRLLGKGRPLIE
jgi:hypothetical protein